MAFSGEPLTRWSGSRNMNLEEDFYFIDNQGIKWNAPKGSCLNGATIPRALWTAIGSPYSGTYRKSSIVHDVAVGELCNPDVSNEDRKKLIVCSMRLAVTKDVADGLPPSYTLVFGLGLGPRN